VRYGDDAPGVLDDEGLDVLDPFGTSGGVAYMPHGDVPGQVLKFSGLYCFG